MSRFARLLVMGLYVVPAMLLALARIRVLSLTHPDRIGHLCVEPDCYLKESALGLRTELFSVLLVPRSSAANATLLDLWAEKLKIVDSKFWCRILAPLAQLPFRSNPMARYAVAINETAACTGILSKWNGRQPLLSLPSGLAERGRNALRRLGVPEGGWYVCVHSREGGYSPGDEHLHSFRNSDIDNYRLALEAVVQSGGWCVRVGEASAAALQPMKGVIDYAHSELKSDWMDVFLCASCAFFLGNSSGLYLLASVFGVPSALANLVPISSAFPVAPGDIGIPKLLRSRTTGDLVKYSEILSSPVGNYRFAEQYASAGLIVEQNSPEDIRDLALEMMQRRRGDVPNDREDEELQLRFRTLFHPGHYSYGADSRIGRQFLRKYSRLLD